MLVTGMEVLVVAVMVVVAHIVHSRVNPIATVHVKT